MENLIKSLDRLVDDIKLLKINLENIYKDSEFEMEEKIEMVLSMREKNFSIDEISNLTGYSIRDVVDILDL